MSEGLDLERGDVLVGNACQDWPSSGTSQPPTGESSLRDSPGPLVSIYSRIAEQDGKMAERWQKDADGILVFTGLFSAAVAALLAVTILDLKQGGSQPQGASAFYLEKIYRVLADPGSSHASFPSTVAQSLLFSPPRYVLWVNSLWFLSLVISLTCAVLATLVQQWARRYVKFIERPRYSPRQRMRVRTFFSHGVVKFHVSWVIEALLLLVHLSLFLFFTGLLVFLSAVNHPLVGAVGWWIIISTTAYICITLLPIFWPNSPYYTPLSPIVWFLYTGLPFLVCEVLSSPLFGTSRHFRTWRDHYHHRFVEGLGKTAEKTASQRSLEIEIRVMISTLEAVVEDDALAEFFESIPGFFYSDRANNLEERLFEEFRIKFSPTLNSFLGRTFSSDSVSESVKSSRLIVCLNATNAVLGSDGITQILFDILNGRWQELLQSVEVASSLRQWSKDTDDEFIHYVQRIVTQVVAGARECDQRWISLVVDEFGVPDDVLRENMGHRESTLLCLLLYMIRQADQSGSWRPWILSSLCQFDICNTPPELQHEFCTLWNNIVRDAWDRRSRVDTTTAVNILREIRRAYIELHRGTEAAHTTFSAQTHYFNPVLANPLSYRFCNIPGHRLHHDPIPDLPPMPISIARRGDSPNSAPQFPLSASFRNAHALTHRHTYPSLSPSVQIPHRASSMDTASIPQSIESTTPRDHTLLRYRYNSLGRTGVSHHAPRQASSSTSGIVVNGVRLTSHIYPSETDGSYQDPASASPTFSFPDQPQTTDSPSSLRPDVPSFPDLGTIHTSPCSTDRRPQADTPDALSPISLTATSSWPLGGNGAPAVLKEDTSASCSEPCNSGIPSTAKPVPRTILPTGNGAAPQRDEDAATAVPSISISDSQLPSPASSTSR